MKKLTTEQLKKRLEDIQTLCEDYYFNQYYIEKNRGNEMFSQMQDKLNQEQELIEAELKSRLSQSEA